MPFFVRPPFLHRQLSTLSCKICSFSERAERTLGHLGRRTRTYTHTHAHTRTHTHAQTHMHGYTHPFSLLSDGLTQVRAHTHTHTHMHRNPNFPFVPICLWVQLCLIMPMLGLVSSTKGTHSQPHAYACTNKLSHTRTYTHTHMHTQTRTHKNALTHIHTSTFFLVQELALTHSQT